MIMKPIYPLWQIWSDCRCREVLLSLLVSTTLAFAGGSISPIFIVNTPAVAPSGGSGDSLAPIITPDGRYVLFASSANNLTLNNSVNPTPSPIPAVLNIYLRDRLAHTTTLVSVSADGNGSGNGDSVPAGISANGRFALFESAGSNLVPGDTYGVYDVFIRDLVANVTTLVSVGTNGSAANGTSRSSVVTPDGRFVAFVSAASNLVPGDSNGIPDVFVRDTQGGVTTLASAGAVPMTTANSSELPQITPDGRYVAFYTTATNLVPGITNSGEVYLADLQQGTTTWASTNTQAILQSLGTKAAFSCDPLISSNGQFAVYEACPTNGGGVVLRYNVTTGLSDVVNTNVVGVLAGLELDAQNFTMTPDGRYIAFLANVDGVKSSVAVWDGQSNTTTYASVDATQTPVTNSICDWLSITPDGRFLAFESNATNLTTNPLATDFHVYVRDLVAGTTALMDTDTNGVGAAQNLLPTPCLSDDGSVVGFACLDSSLVVNDNNRAYDVFARDRNAASAELISSGLPGLPSLTPNASCVFSSACVSTNGRYVAFWSEADNLAGGDTNGLRDVYVHDLLIGTNYLVSVNTNGVSGNGLSTDPAISGNGQFVAFTSYASDLVANDTNNAPDVFLRNLLTGTTTLVSVSTAGSTPGSGASYSPSISIDGRYVLFFSQAGNLVPLGNSGGNLFWRDMQSGTNRAITTYTSSTTINAINAAMTPDGQRVAYSVQINNASTATFYVWAAPSGNNVYTNVASTSIYKTAISPDGNRIVFYQTNQVVLADLNAKTQFNFGNALSRAGCQFSADSQSLAFVAGTNQIYLYNFPSASNLLVSTGANGFCDSPAISADGRFVAYRSFASNLVANDTNGVPDILLYDSLAGTTTLVTASPLGNWPANGRSLNPVFSGDGQTLVWQSWANNLAGQDFNQWCNLYALQSFATNSSGAGEPFSVSGIALSSLDGFGSSADAATLIWPASVGATYQVQFADNLNDPQWQALTNAARIIGTQGYMVDVVTNNSQRFYRVVEFAF